MELTRQQVAELSEFYWDTDVSTKELQDYFGLPRAVHRYINPLAAGEECPNCSAVQGARALGISFGDNCTELPFKPASFAGASSGLDVKRSASAGGARPGEILVQGPG